MRPLRLQLEGFSTFRERVVVEDDAMIAEAITAIGKLRSAGFSAEMIATGSPRKRFDKASKLDADSLVSFAGPDDVRIRGERQAEIERVIG